VASAYDPCLPFQAHGSEWGFALVLVTRYRLLLVVWCACTRDSCAFVLVWLGWLLQWLFAARLGVVVRPSAFVPYCGVRFTSCLVRLGRSLWHPGTQCIALQQA
jgi:hypothetical protein